MWCGGNFSNNENHVICTDYYALFCACTMHIFFRYICWFLCVNLPLVLVSYSTCGEDKIWNNTNREVAHQFPKFNDDLTGLWKASIFLSLQCWEGAWSKRQGVLLNGRISFLSRVQSPILTVQHLWTHITEWIRSSQTIFFPKKWRQTHSFLINWRRETF